MAEEKNISNIKTEEISIANQDKKYKKQISTFVIKVVALSLILFVTFSYVFGVFIVQGEAMYPRVRNGDLLIYYRLDKNYENNTVVVIDRNKTTNVSRIVAKEGDVITLSNDGQLEINGNIRDEEVFFETMEIIGGIEYPYTVPKDSFFVLSDYRTQSSDSRFFGAVSKEDIKGQLITLIRRRDF